MVPLNHNDWWWIALVEDLLEDLLEEYFLLAVVLLFGVAWTGAGLFIQLWAGRKQGRQDLVVRQVKKLGVIVLYPLVVLGLIEYMNGSGLIPEALERLGLLEAAFKVCAVIGGVVATILYRRIAGPARIDDR